MQNGAHTTAKHNNGVSALQTPSPQSRLAGKEASTEAQRPALSIVIVSWNTRDLLKACLDSVVEELQTSQLAVELFVVDNASTDGGAQMVRIDYPWVRLIANTHNPGFAGANNQALALIQGRYALLLNPDTVVLPGSLGSLVVFMDAHPEAGAAGSRLLNADGSLQVSCYPQPTPIRELLRMFHLDRPQNGTAYNMHAWPTDRPQPVDVVQGASMIVRREVLYQIGVLDAGYYMYSEEVDWCYRIQQGGWRIYWVPASAVIHYGGQSTKQIGDKMFLQLYRGKIQYFRKHWGALATMFYKAILAAATLARLVASPLAWFEPQPRRDKHFQLARQYRLLLVSLPKM